MKFTKEVATTIIQGQGIYDMIALSRKYYPAYPVRPSKPAFSARDITVEQAKEYIIELEKFEQEQLEYNTARDNYNTAKAEVDAIVEEMIKIETGFYNYVPPANQAKVWAKAWEDGHANGYGEVYSCLSNLVDLFA